MVKAYLAVFLAGTLLMAAAPSFAQRSLGIEVAQAAFNVSQEVGKRLTLVCPASDGTKGYVYGTDTYADSSAICAAAIHAGVLVSGRAGAVSIVIGPGGQSYTGSERNGVTSQRLSSARSSFSFERRGTEPATISWTTVWSAVPQEFTEPVVVACPPGGNTSAPVWGTDVYISDSAICVAAVHAGAITAEKGGAISVARVPGLARHEGTERNKVASRTWGAWKDAFSIKPATVVVASTPPPPGSPATIGPRTVTAAGFTIAGVTPPGSPATIAPRTVQAAGFTIAGMTPPNQPNITPRTITAAGFTISGVTPTP